MSLYVSQTGVEDTDQARLTPMLALNDDIGIEILKAAFQHHFPSCHNDDGISPVPISHVNRWWRHLALSTPQIWTCIHVTTTHLGREDSSEIVEAYLARSKNLPLSVTISCHTERPETMLRYGPTLEWSMFKETVGRRYFRAWQLTFAHHHRWRHFALFGRRREFFDEFLQDMQGATFPQLEHLGLYLLYRDIGRTSYGFNFATPQLLRLDFSRCSLGTLYPGHAALTTLVEIRLAHTAVAANHLLKILGSTSIATLILADVRIAGNAIAGLATFPNLRNLYLSRVSPLTPSSKTFVFALLDGADSLTSLYLEDRKAVDMTSLAADMILHTVQKLTVVNLESLPETEWIVFLHRFPALRALHLIRNSGVDGMALRAMRMSDEQERESEGVCVLPSLEVLVMEHFVCREVLLFVRHRASIGKPISEVLLPEMFLMGEAQFIRDTINWCKLYSLPLARMYTLFGPRFRFWGRERDAPQFHCLEDAERSSRRERKPVL